MSSVIDSSRLFHFCSPLSSFLSIIELTCDFDCDIYAQSGTNMNQPPRWKSVLVNRLKVLFNRSDINSSRSSIYELRSEWQNHDLYLKNLASQNVQNLCIYRYFLRSFNWWRVLMTMIRQSWQFWRQSMLCHKDNLILALVLSHISSVWETQKFNKPELKKIFIYKTNL